MSTLRLSPAERAEILVDFSQFETGDKISLINTTSGVIDSASKKDSEDDAETTELMEFVVTGNESSITEILKKLFEIETTDQSRTVKKRVINLAVVRDFITL